MNHSITPRRQNGFTLLELLVVLVILKKMGIKFCIEKKFL